jgi:hypothetical protein
MSTAAYSFIFIYNLSLQVSITKDMEDKCLVVEGKGTCRQIQLLRTAILQLIHYDRAMSYGAFRSKANMYVMDGATMLYPRKSESAHCMLALEPYLGQVNRAHRDLAPAFILSMRSTCCSDDSWMKTFQTAFVVKVLYNTPYYIHVYLKSNCFCTQNK